MKLNVSIFLNWYYSVYTVLNLRDNHVMILYIWKSIKMPAFQSFCNKVITSTLLSEQASHLEAPNKTRMVNMTMFLLSFECKRCGDKLGILLFFLFVSSLLFKNIFMKWN